MRHRVEDFPFRIRDVQELMGFSLSRSHAEDSDFNCIFCGGKAKMNINYRKNVYGCVKCGAGGGMLGLYASYYNLTAREAYDEIVKNLSLRNRLKLQSLLHGKIWKRLCLKVSEPQRMRSIIHIRYCSPT